MKFSSNTLILFSAIGYFDVAFASKKRSKEIALEYIRNEGKPIELSDGDVLYIGVPNVATSKNPMYEHVYMVQEAKDLKIFNAVANVVVDPTNEMVKSANSKRLVANTRKCSDKRPPKLTTEEAILKAAEVLGIDRNLFSYELDGEMELGYYDNPRKGCDLRKVWDFDLHVWDFAWDFVWDVVWDFLWDWVWDFKGSDAQWDIVLHFDVDAVSGDIVNLEVLLMDVVDEGYHVYAMPKEAPCANCYIYDTPYFDPDHIDPLTEVRNSATTKASPNGWLTIGTTTFTATIGNNVDASENIAGEFVGAGNKAPQTSPGEFDYSSLINSMNTATNSSLWVNAAITNMFYWTNVMHDVLYEYGFDEASGNFQVDNFGKGGKGGDALIAFAQDGSKRNGASMIVPADGRSPIMRMGLFDGYNGGPPIDSSFDAGIIAHEYCHGLSVRLTGGAFTNTCLGYENAGEGWSDFCALWITATTSGEFHRPIGAWVKKDNNGVRPRLYSPDMTINEVTYGYINNTTESFPIKSVRHEIGFIFASVLWDLHCYLSKVEGWNYDKYNPDIGGNNKAFQLVVEGLKLQPCKPNFIDSRDAILQADKNLYGGRYKCMIWQIFARRGLGDRAISNTGYSPPISVIESFTIPSNVKDCPTLGNDVWWLRSAEILDLLLSEAPSLNADKVLDSLAFSWLVNDAYTNNMLDNIQENTSKYLLERYVLAVLAYDTNIDTWDSHLDFLNQRKSHCDWNMIVDGWTYGAVCDDDGFVYRIDLDENNLTGQIPTELFMLPNLIVLRLIKNNLIGTIPTEVGMLSHLTRLVMSFNNLIGTIPTEVGLLSHLTKLVIDANSLTGTIPTELGNAIKLTELYLTHNPLTGTIPTEIGNLASIDSIGFGYHQLTGTIPTELARLQRLVSLNLDANDLTGTLPTELGNLKSLGGLGLRYNSLTGTIPTEFGNLNRLRGLDLMGLRLTGTIPTELGNLSGIRELLIKKNQLTGTVPTEFANLSNLRRFYLDLNNLTGNIDSLFCTGGPALDEPVRIDCDEVYCTCCDDRYGNPCAP